jgi:hypothetical protein
MPPIPNLRASDHPGDAHIIARIAGKALGHGDEETIQQRGKVATPPLMIWIFRFIEYLVLYF